MKFLNKVMTARLRRVLICQVGDMRECPHCHKAFIPHDITSREVWDLYRVLFREKGARRLGDKIF